MLQEFESYIHQNKLFSANDRLLLAISGGIDSMVLADLIYKEGYDFSIAHCNFQLRGTESDMDEKLVRETADHYGVSFYLKKFDTQSYSRKNKVSIQMAARELRYGWFTQLIHGNQFDYLVTAHHLNDAFETAIFNLTKGTGIAGLRGMLAIEGQIKRPLLCFEKETISKYAKKQQIAWREDLSNKSNKYARNLIRNEVIPRLKEVNPDLIRTYQQSALKFRGAEKLVNRYLEEIRARIEKKLGPDILFDINQLLLTADPTFVLYRLLRDFGFNYHQATGIIGRIDEAGKIFLTDHYQLNVDREYLILTKISHEKEASYMINAGDRHLKTKWFTFSFRQINSKDHQIKPEKHVALLDSNKLNFPLTARNWQAGDWFIPLGMKHKKKISDFMIDNKIPLNLKHRIMVITSADRIIWVAGYRIDDQFKISEVTTSILELKMNIND